MKFQYDFPPSNFIFKRAGIIIVPLFDTSIAVWLLHTSLYSNGNCSQIPSQIHIDFYVFTWPGDFKDFGL